MRSEHGNSLHFISSAVHFLYKNFPKRRFSLHKHPPKKPFFGIFFQKIAPQNPRLAPWGRPAVPTRRPSPALLYQRLHRGVSGKLWEVVAWSNFTSLRVLMFCQLAFAQLLMCFLRKMKKVTTLSRGESLFKLSGKPRYRESARWGGRDVFGSKMGE